MMMRRYANINGLMLYLKNLGYQDIPKIQYENSYNVSEMCIDIFCNKIIIEYFYF